MLNRRNFLLGAASGFAIASQVDSLFGRALAASVPGGDRVLVVIELQGGNDGLNTVIPYTSDDYYRLRPSLAIPRNNVLPLNADLGLNPVLAPIKTMFDHGRVAVIEGVGYPDPDHSHFRSSEIWQTAVPQNFERTGWLGRALDATGSDHKNLFRAVSLTDVIPQTLLANVSDVPAIAATRGYGLSSDRNTDMRTAVSEILTQDDASLRSPYLAHVAEIEEHAQRGSEEIGHLIAGYKPEATYPPTQIGRSLALAARMIGSRLGSRIVYVRHGSFDTHIGQRATQDRLLGQLADAVTAFYADLEAHDTARKTLTMTFSEFGRRAAENASKGTDHGEAAPLFLFGPVRGGVYGEAPRLDMLAEGNVPFSTDFRSVYATILDRWLGASSRPILGGSFPAMPILG